MKTANRILMFLAAAILLFATAAKIHELLNYPIVSKTFWESWLFFLIQIPLELGLAIWLLSGLFRKAAWLTTIFAFAVFIGVTLTKALLGYESCGCFGQIHVKPWITLLTLDVPFLITLVILPPKHEKLLPPPWPKSAHFFSTAIIYIIALAIIMPTLINNKVEPQTVTDLSGKRWTLLDNIDIADELSQGLWFVLLYHNDCPICTECIPLYEQYQTSFQGNEDAIKFAFIEMPPYEPIESRLVPEDTTVTTGWLDDSQKWLYNTPVVVVLLDSIALAAWDGSYGSCPTLEQLLNAISTE